jgi:hypothetical protein
MVDYEYIPIDEFNDMARQPELWSDGPYVETFGSGYGDPYNPHREVRGILKTGRAIRSEL